MGAAQPGSTRSNCAWTLSVQPAERIVGDSLVEEAQRRGTVDRFLTSLDRR